MKKFYSMLLTAAVALSASAAHQVTERTIDLSNVRYANNDFMAASQRAEGTTDAPASLEGKSAMFSFSLIEDDKTYNMTSSVTFSEEKEENGALYYKMSTFLDGLYNGVTLYDLEVGYIAETGTLYLFGDQDFITFPLTDGTTATCGLWAANADGNCVCANYRFTYENGTFTFVNPFTVQFEGQDPEQFTASSMLLGRVNGNQLSYYVELGADMSIMPVTGNGNMTFKLGENDYNPSCPADLDGNTLTLYNFATLSDVKFTVDPAAKTVKAENQKTVVQKYTVCYCNVDANGDCIKEGNKFVLTGTYTVADGKTTITYPDFNLFVNQFGISGNPAAFSTNFTNAKVVLDFDLGVEDSGIEGVAADAAIVDGPAKFYNLQGVEVANPAAGQVVIKVQGSKATKMVVR